MNSISNEVQATIGASAAGTGFFAGSLREMTIYDHALTPTDVSTLYAGGAGVYGAAGITGLLAGYHGDVTNSRVSDFSDNGNDGTVFGGVTAVTGHVETSVATATYTTIPADLPAGSHSITAVWSGDGSVSNTVSEVVNQATPTVTLLSSANSTFTGQGVTLKAILPADAAGATVAFQDDGTTVYSETASSSTGSALSFDQTDTSYLTIPASDSLDSLTDGSNSLLTIAGWIYPTADMPNSGIFYKGPLDGRQGVISLGFTQGVGKENKLNFRLNGAVGGAGHVSSSTYIPDNQWTFIACTYDGANEDIYINGCAGRHGPLHRAARERCQQFLRRRILFDGLHVRRAIPELQRQY